MLKWSAPHKWQINVLIIWLWINIVIYKIYWLGSLRHLKYREMKPLSLIFRISNIWICHFLSFYLLIFLLKKFLKVKSQWSESFLGKSKDSRTRAGRPQNQEILNIEWPLRTINSRNKSKQTKFHTSLNDTNLVYLNDPYFIQRV